MARFKITIFVETDADPSSLLDAFDHLLADGDDDLGTGEEVRLDRARNEEGTAVSVESL